MSILSQGNEFSTTVDMGFTPQHHRKGMKPIKASQPWGTQGPLHSFPTERQWALPSGVFTLGHSIICYYVHFILIFSDTFILSFVTYKKTANFLGNISGGHSCSFPSSSYLQGKANIKWFISGGECIHRKNASVSWLAPKLLFKKGKERERK